MQSSRDQLVGDEGNEGDMETRVDDLLMSSEPVGQIKRPGRALNARHPYDSGT